MIFGAKSRKGNEPGEPRLGPRMNLRHMDAQARQKDQAPQGHEAESTGGTGWHRVRIWEGARSGIGVEDAGGRGE